MPEQTAVEGWFNQTTLHPLGIIVLLLLGAATFALPRRYALVPTLVLACGLASAQRIVLATLDFNFLRVMVFVVWARILIRGETTSFRWKSIDTVFVSWALIASAATTVLFGTYAGLINRLGMLYDAVGLYFMCRFLVRDWRDVRSFAQCAALISAPVALAFLVEKLTGRNLFSIFGGVPEYTIVRLGRLRCQGPFIHSILAGTFWAALAPLIGALWWSRGWNRPLAVGGVICSVWIVLACASATPLGGILFGAAAAALFPLRRWLSWIRWSALAGLMALHLMMNNPVWHLLARVPLVDGSTGWYRYKLIDEFVRHVGEWWLVGTRAYPSWPGPGFEAITNEFVQQGVHGGLLTLALFVGVIAMAFVGIGRARRDAAVHRICRIDRDGERHLITARSAPPAARQALIWALGVTMFIHCVVFIGVTYYGQIILVWYLTLGFIGSLTPDRTRVAAARTRLARHAHAQLRYG